MIPRIDNSNVDRSIGTIHSTIVRVLRKLEEGEKIRDQRTKQCLTLHKEYNVVTKNQLSSTEAKKFIQEKVNKNEVLERFFAENENYDDLQIRLSKS